MGLHDPVASMYRTPVTMTPAILDGQVLIAEATGHVFIGTGRWTERDRVRELARRIVRHGLADVLTWIGEDVGPRPDQAIPLYTGAQLLETLRR